MATRYLHISALLAALAAGTACGVDPVPVTPSALPAHGTPANIELSASAGVGAQGGTAALQARVQDAYGATLPEVLVTFSADAGTLSETSAKTDGNGVAHSTLTAEPGTVKVRATAGTVTAPDVPVAVQPVNVFVPPPGLPPPPPEPPLPPIPPPPAPQPAYSVSLVATPTSVVIGTATTLTATVTSFNGASAPTIWEWDCDASATSIDATTPNSTTCNYATAGTFTARVFVRGGAALASATATVTVTAPPSPAITVNCTQAPAPAVFTVNCNVSATLNGAVVPSASIVAGTWDFGDTISGTSLTNSTQHVYGAALKYTVLVSNISVPGTPVKGTGLTTVDVK